MITGDPCPRCGKPSEELLPVDAGLKQRLLEFTQESVPDEVCQKCHADFSANLSHGAQARLEEKAKAENRMAMWKGRIALVKQGRAYMAQKMFSEAAVTYEKYIRVIEIIFEVESGTLKPEHFKNNSRTKELTIITTVYWDLLQIYDTSPKYGSRQAKAGRKLAEFARFTPIYPNVIRRAQSFAKRAKNPHVIKGFLKSANASRPRCFIATATFDSPYAIEVRLLCQLRDQKLYRSFWGRSFIAVYYRISPQIARWIERHPSCKAPLRKLLRFIALHVR